MPVVPGEHLIVVAEIPPLRPGPWTPHAREQAVVYFDIEQAQTLVEMSLVLRLEIGVTQARHPPLRSRRRPPHARELPVVHAQADQAQALVEIRLVFGFEIVEAESGGPPLRAAARPPHVGELSAVDLISTSRWPSSKYFLSLA